MPPEGVTVYPTAALRSMIEQTFNADLDPERKRRELETLREQLMTMVGSIEQYVGTLENGRQAASIQAQAQMAEARENAAIREEMVRRGLATAEEMDKIGYVSHAQLSLAEADGTAEDLLEGIFSRSGGWGLSLLRGPAFEAAIRRNRRTGQFRDQPGGTAPSVNLPSGTASAATTRVRRARPFAGEPPKREVGAPSGRGSTPAYHNPRPPAELAPDLADYSAATDAERRRTVHPAITREGHEALRELRTGKPSGVGATRSREDVEAELDLYDRGEHPMQDEIERFDIERDLEMTGESFRDRARSRRVDEMEKRVARLAREGVAEGTEAETNFNTAGKVSQHTLLRYIRDALTTPSTVDMHTSLDDQGNRVWDDDRAALHEAIIDLILRQRKTVPDPERPGKTKEVLCAECDYYPDAGEMRTVLFSGGGYSAGKGGIIKKLAKDGRIPENALKIDPDEIKALLPEFASTLEADPEANLRVYEESWEISQEVMRLAQARGMNVIVDGITNTSPEEVESRLKSFVDPDPETGGKPYVNPQIIYVDIPTEEALGRAANRALTAEQASDRRHIPEVIMRAVHRDVAATIPNVTDVAAKYGARLEVWDNDQGKFGDGQQPDEVIPEGKEAGDFRPPKRFLSMGEDHYEIEDQALFDRLLEKGHETIEGVDRPKERLLRRLLDRVDLNGKDPPPRGEAADRVLGTFRDTFDKYSVTLPDGTILWDPRRRAKHEEIIEGMLTDEEGNPLPSFPEGEREALYTAGMPASGKTSAIVPRHGPDAAAHIDSDNVKEELDEYQALKAARDRYSGASSQRESRMIAHMAEERALSQGNNVIVEGTGDGAPGDFHRRLQAAQAQHYNVKVGVVDLPIEKAKQRAAVRGIRDGRWIRDETLEKYSSAVPARFAEWKDDPTIEWALYSTDVPFGAEPKPIAAKPRYGQISFADQAAYENFLERARWETERGLPH